MQRLRYSTISEPFNLFSRSACEWTVLYVTAQLITYMKIIIGDTSHFILSSLRVQGRELTSASLPESRPEYFPPQIRHMNSRFHSEAKLPLAMWVPCNQLHSVISTFDQSRGVAFFPPFPNIFPPKGFKMPPILRYAAVSKLISTMMIQETSRMSKFLIPLLH